MSVTNYEKIVLVMHYKCHVSKPIDKNKAIQGEEGKQNLNLSEPIHGFQHEYTFYYPYLLFPFL